MRRARCIGEPLVFTLGLWPSGGVCRQCAVQVRAVIAREAGAQRGEPEHYAVGALDGELEHCVPGAQRGELERCVAGVRDVQLEHCVPGVLDGLREHCAAGVRDVQPERCVAGVLDGLRERRAAGVRDVRLERCVVLWRAGCYARLLLERRVAQWPVHRVVPLPVHHAVPLLVRRAARLRWCVGPWWRVAARRAAVPAGRLRGVRRWSGLRLRGALMRPLPVCRGWRSRTAACYARQPALPDAARGALRYGSDASRRFQTDAGER